MMKIANKRFENAIHSIPQATPPVWFMRQAGRYHEHYQKLRAKYSFIELCKKPDIAAEVALGPIEDFDFDVSILFSDLLFPLDCLGMGLDYNPAPSLEWQLRPETMSQLKDPITAVKGMEFQAEAVIKTRERLPEDKSLIGFVGGPWTLFAYAVDGSHKGHLIESKRYFELYEKFAEIMTVFLIENIKLQLDAGAEVVMVMDTAAGELSPALYLRHVLPHIEKIAENFPKRLGYYSKGTTQDHYEHPLFSRESNLAGVGFDHRFDLKKQLENANRPGFIQGNFDQTLLFLPHEAFKIEVERFFTHIAKLSDQERKGWVAGLGHGVLPKSPNENVRYFVQRLREFFK